MEETGRFVEGQRVEDRALGGGELVPLMDEPGAARHRVVHPAEAALSTQARVERHACEGAMPNDMNHSTTAVVSSAVVADVEPFDVKFELGC